jgi:O-glycosyl hydrolase
VLQNEEMQEVRSYIRLGLTPILIFSSLSDGYMRAAPDHKIKIFFDNWIKNWKTKSLQAYIDAYHSDFLTEGKDKAAWKNYKSRLNEKYARIQIEPKNVFFYLHPKYAPVNRYAADIIGCLNNWVDGWVDWNMVLDTNGGPNWFKNWCIAPVIVNPDTDEVYFTPLYYVMSHFSKFMRPGAVKIGCKIDNIDVLATAVRNSDGSIALVVFNPTEKNQNIEIKLTNKTKTISINAKALQTVVIR